MRFTLAALPLFAALALPATSSAARISIDDDSWVSISGYMQPWLYLAVDADEGGVTPDFYLRRGFLFTNGRISDKAGFFLGGLATNLGKAGELNNSFSIIDVWFEYHYSAAFGVDVGLFRVPFTRHHLVAGSKLHGLDFHSTFNKQSGVASLRDMGVQARGLLIGEHLEYRVALLDGFEPNPLNGVPRIMARVSYHAFDADKGLKVWGAHLGEKKYLSISGAVDLEPMTGVSGEDFAWSAAADLLADIPLGDNGVVATAVYQVHGPDGTMPEGMGVWGDLGFRIDRVEPLAAAEWYQPADGDAGARLAMMGGVNWWLSGHDISLKAQLGAAKVDGSDDWNPEAVVQTQLAF